MSDSNQNWAVPAALEAEADALVARYPQKRSASLMVLHALQEHFGFISPEAVKWTAAKTGVGPIQIYELVTFYPMFRQQPVGKYHFKVCRTLSCALAGSHELFGHLCAKLGLDTHGHGPQTSADGQVTVEFVECLASCGSGPAVMVNDDFYERMTVEQADALLAKLKGGKP
jgi:NADH-quinone oxidoreductase subunit E